ncbi:MAG: Prolipoprotein diacylglyceryl transferase [Anaerolineae bacterium]|jgi:phosphatidylglycerol:prolipoprotein diacylglycerol transferase|nr:MAG: Prolipoprotein diacylglyceryl transferase [Anaerolineae bacterium]
MLPILQIGPLALRTPLLLALLGLYLGVSLAERRLPKDALTAGQLNTLVFLGLGCGLIAARLAFALEHWALFAEAPLSLISLDGGLLDPWAGSAAGMLAMLIYGQRQQLSFWTTLDALTPLLAVWVVFLSLAFLASGEVYGMPTDLPWGVEQWGEKRHPVALYQALAGFLILIGLWSKFGKGSFAGQVFLQFTLFTAAVWLFLEGWRANSPLLPGGIRSIQALAWLVMGFAFWLLDRRARETL